MTKKRNSEDVTTCTCASLRRATRVVTQIFDESLQPVGLKVTQFSLLATLSKRNDLPLSKLAELMVMDRTTLTRNLKPLVAQNLIDIVQEEDRRVRRILLTDKGRKTLDEAMPLWQSAQSHMVDALGQKRWQSLLDDLGLVVEASHKL